MIRSLLLILSGALVLWAQDGELKFANLGDFRLESGDVIHECRIGYRVFGNLNSERSNAVLFPTWFTGTTQDLAANIGPGKVVDSTTYYVIAVDALGDGVSISPSNSVPQPRLHFPQFSIRDMVESQHRLLTEHLQLNHVHAVIGISMGGMQTFQWLLAYPAFMDRVIPIVGSPKLTPYDLLLWEAEKHAIEEAAEWKNGDYTERPAKAMATVSDIHHLALSTPEHFNNLNRDRNFAESLAAGEEETLRGFDTNNWYRQLQAMIGLDIYRAFGDDPARAAGAARAKATVVVATRDHMVNPRPALEFALLIHAEIVRLEGDCGHLSTSCELPKLSAAVARGLR